MTDILGNEDASQPFCLWDVCLSFVKYWRRFQLLKCDCQEDLNPGGNQKCGNNKKNANWVYMCV